MKTTIIIAMLLCVCACRSEGPGGRQPPGDFPVTLTVPDMAPIQGTLTVVFWEMSTGSGTERWASLDFLARAPNGVTVTNPVVVPESSFTAFIQGQRIVLPDSSGNPFGYGTVSTDEDGFPVNVTTWRTVSAIRMHPTGNGDVTIDLEFDQGHYDDGGVASGGPTVGTFHGRTDFSCIPQDGQMDPLFKFDSYCVGIWDASGGLGALSTSFAAR